MDNIEFDYYFNNTDAPIELELELILPTDIINQLEIFDEFDIIQIHQKNIQERNIIIQFELVIKELSSRKY
jgi:hypothetical protein